jgi:thioredoxin 1
MSEKIAQLDNATFAAGIAGATPVLVDFWAPWCGPCKAIAPILDELATELDGKLKIAKVNVDDNGDLAAKYGVRAIPTMLPVQGRPARRTVCRHDGQGLAQGEARRQDLRPAPALLSPRRSVSAVFVSYRPRTKPAHSSTPNTDR